MDQNNKLRWGQVYSPADIVTYILAKTLIPALTDIPIDKIKVLEPACGDGQFLVEIYDLLLREYQRQGWQKAMAARNILSYQLYGMDINVQAVDQARLVLRKKSGRIPGCIACGDTLDKRRVYLEVPLVADYYDVIAGNPPYVTWEIEKETRVFYRKHYRTAARGRINLYRLFIERCIELLKPDGYLGFICPNTYLTDRDSQLLRQLLLEHTHILEIVCLSESTAVFSGVTQATTILIMQKKQKPSPHHQVCIKRVKELQSNQERMHVPQWYWQEKTGGKFRLLPVCCETVIEKLYQGRQLGDIAKIYQGEINLTLNKQDLQDAPTCNNYPLMRGCHIIPYGFLPEQQRDKLSYIQPSRQVRAHAGCKRLVLQQVSNMSQSLRLKCGLLTPQRPIFCANSTNYILLPDQDITMYYYLMALCHSTVWNLLFNIGSSTNHVTVRELEILPVPDCTIPIRQHLADLVEKISHNNNTMHAGELAQSINDIIYQLFSLDRHDADLIENYWRNMIKSLL